MTITIPIELIEFLKCVSINFSFFVVGFWFGACMEHKAIKDKNK